MQASLGKLGSRAETGVRREEPQHLVLLVSPPCQATRTFWVVDGPWASLETPLLLPHTWQARGSRAPPCSISGETRNGSLLGLLIWGPQNTEGFPSGSAQDPRGTTALWSVHPSVIQKVLHLPVFLEPLTSLTIL